MLEGKRYGVEHALSMYADSFVHLPAKGIYEEAILESVQEVARKCHIYMIGLLPSIHFDGAEKSDSTLVTFHTVLGQEYRLDWEVPPELELKQEDGYWFLSDHQDNRYFIPEEQMMNRLIRTAEGTDFKVLYIGQAYGTDGSRNALDRLIKHETLQKIAVTGLPENYNLHLLLLEIHEDNRTLTLLNPRAIDNSSETSEERISKGTAKLFNTSEEEKITLYEASLIRYFQPKYNKIFKDSFPSTNMKSLADCYEKDFSAVMSEIYIDEIPFKLYSDYIEPQHRHMAHFDLHKAEDRQVFFSRKHSEK